LAFRRAFGVAGAGDPFAQPGGGGRRDHGGERFFGARVAQRGTQLVTRRRFGRARDQAMEFGFERVVGIFHE